jgi:hypothetical protein
MAENSALVLYLIKHPSALLQTDFLREMFMIPERLTGVRSEDHSFTITTRAPLYVGQLFVVDKVFYGITSFQRTDNRGSDVKTYRVEAINASIRYAGDDAPLATPQDPITIGAGDIENYTGETITTTLGTFVANWLFLVYPFGGVIPYLNEEFTTSKLESRIAPLLLDGSITVDQVKDRYINTLSLHGTLCEVFCPNITEKVIVIPQSIHDLREKLVSENQAALEAGDAAVMSQIEGQLIAAYKDYLKGDPSMHFLLKKKYFDVVLKKLFLTQGMTEIFGSPGKFVFIKQPMGQGWQQEDLSYIYNETRSGSYSRGIETQNGGVIAKLILRVFQDTRITIPDCETTHGEIVNGQESTLKDFIGNYVVAKNGAPYEGGPVVLTADTLNHHLGSVLTIRTPGYCESPHGFCARCFGELFEKLGQQAIAPLANDFAKTITTAALKRMHGVSHKTTSVKDLDRYILAA